MTDLTFSKGQTVRLTVHGIKAQTITRKKGQRNWGLRIGVIQRIDHFGGIVVKWQGNKWPADTPLSAACLELV